MENDQWQVLSQRDLAELLLQVFVRFYLQGRTVANRWYFLPALTELAGLEAWPPNQLQVESLSYLKRIGLVQMVYQGVGEYGLTAAAVDLYIDKDAEDLTLSEEDAWELIAGAIERRERRRDVRTDIHIVMAEIIRMGARPRPPQRQIQTWLRSFVSKGWLVEVSNDFHTVYGRYRLAKAQRRLRDLPDDPYGSTKDGFEETYERDTAWAHITDLHMLSTALNALLTMRHRDQRQASLDDLCREGAELWAIKQPAPDDRMLEALQSLESTRLLVVSQDQQFSLSLSGELLHL